MSGSKKVGRPCKACNSLHLEEINRRIARGEPFREISLWLRETYGEEISFKALSNHVKNHLPPCDVLPSKLLYDKLMELDEEIDVAKEASRIIVEYRRTLATLMAKEAVLSVRAKEPVILDREKRLLLESYMRALEIYNRIVSSLKTHIDPATFYSRRRKELEEAGIYDLSKIDFSKLPSRKDIKRKKRKEEEKKEDGKNRV